MQVGQLVLEYCIQLVIACSLSPNIFTRNVEKRHINIYLKQKNIFVIKFINRNEKYLIVNSIRCPVPCT